MIRAPALLALALELAGCAPPPRPAPPPRLVFSVRDCEQQRHVWALEADAAQIAAGGLLVELRFWCRYCGELGRATVIPDPD